MKQIWVRTNLNTRLQEQFIVVDVSKKTIVVLSGSRHHKKTKKYIRAGDFIQTDVFGTFTLLEAMKNAKLTNCKYHPIEEVKLGRAIKIPKFED